MRSRRCWPRAPNSSKLHTVNQNQFPIERQPALTELHHCQVCGGRESAPAYRFPQRLPWAERAAEQVVRRCLECGFLFLSPRPDRATLAAHYAADSHGSGQVFRVEDRGSRAELAARRRAAFASAILPAGSGILDIGCGQGLFLAALSAAGLAPTGLEPSPAAAARAAARGLPVIAGMLGQDTGQAFDAVSMISVLEHLWDPAEGVRQALRALRPGGMLVLEVPDALHPTPALTDFFSFEHLSHFTPATLSRLLMAQGLRWAILDEKVERGSIRMAASAASESPGPGWTSLETVMASHPRLALADDSYARRQAALVQGVAARVAALVAQWQGEGRAFAIYGAGLHSLQLLELVPLQRAAACFLDGDPRKAGTWFCGLPVHLPEALPQLGVRAVLLSTAVFAAEMTARIKAIPDLDVAVADCYGEGIDDFR